jgi:hypothetical protein
MATARQTGRQTNGNRAHQSAMELATAARDTVEAMTGRKAESVSSVEWQDDHWLVTVDVCELQRTPNTTDVMATYTVELDPEGGLLGYKRTRRYTRGQTEA